MLELSLFSSHIAAAHVARDIVHNLLSHGIVENLVEQGAGLLVVGVWVSVCVPAKWSVHGLGMNFVGSSSLLWPVDSSWFVVWCGTVATSNIHDTITLVVGRSHSCSVWAVDWDLVVVGSKSMSVSVRIVDESSLKHFAV